MERFYKTLLFNLPDVVYQINAMGEFVYVNDSIAELGYDPRELIGKHFDTIIQPEDRDTIDRMIYFGGDTVGKPARQPKFFNERRTNERITRNLRVRLRPRSPAANREPILGEVFASGLYKPGPERGKKFIGTVGIIRYVNESLRSAKTLSKTEQYYRLLIENSFEIIMITAHDGTVLYASSSVERVLGRASFGLIGESIRDIVHSDDVRAVEAAIGGRRAGQRPRRRMEFRLVDGAGGVKHFEAAITMIADECHGAAMCYVFHAIDITARKEIESAMEKRERIYKILLRTSPDAIVLFDADGDIIMANDRASELLGQRREELIGRHFMSFLFEKEKARASNLRRRMVLARVMQSYFLNNVFTLRRDDGGELPVEVSFSAINDPGGIVEGYLAVIRDITERRRAEEDKRRLEEELLRIVTSRLSGREIELLKYIHDGLSWPAHKREIGKAMDVIPGTLDKFVSRIKQKMGAADMDEIVNIAALRFKWFR